jgi:hypothetical protein
MEQQEFEIRRGERRIILLETTTSNQQPAAQQQQAHPTPSPQPVPSSDVSDFAALEHDESSDDNEEDKREGFCLKVLKAKFSLLASCVRE